MLHFGEKGLTDIARVSFNHFKLFRPIPWRKHTSSEGCNILEEWFSNYVPQQGSAKLDQEFREKTSVKADFNF